MAKTFYTSGTGNQQTTNKINDEKIPVYDTKAAATADLANLAEGQIIATKDGAASDINTLTTYIDTNTIRKYDIDIPVPSVSLANKFEALLYQLQHTDWSIITSVTNRTCAGKFLLNGWWFGSYTATHQDNGFIIVFGALSYAGIASDFAAGYDANSATWTYTIGGERLIYSQGGWVVTAKDNNGVSVYTVNGGGSARSYLAMTDAIGKTGQRLRGNFFLKPNIPLTVTTKATMDNNPAYTRTMPVDGWWVSDAYFWNPDYDHAAWTFSWQTAWENNSINMWGAGLDDTICYAYGQFIG